MIRPKDLRIGNCFYPTETKEGINVPVTSYVFQVDSIDKFGEVKVIDPTQPGTMIFKCSEIEPIPLTPEILTAAGFTMLGNRLCLTVTDLFTFGKQIRGDDVILFFEEEHAEIAVRYLHQLQNLYHALTGQELTVNLASTPYTHS